MTPAKRRDEHAGHAVACMRKIDAETDPALYRDGKVILNLAQAMRTLVLAEQAHTHAVSAATWARRTHPRLFMPRTK